MSTLHRGDFTRPTYVYRPVVTQWPDWCPEGWDRVYSDRERDGTKPPPDTLRELLDSGKLPDDLPHERMEGRDGVELGCWEFVALPRRDRIHWLSAAAANRWVRHALAVGAVAHVERGIVGRWEVAA